MMTKYLVECTDDLGVVRGLWDRIEEHGQSMTAAELLVIDLNKIFSNYKYDVRPVTDEEAERMVMA